MYGSGVRQGALSEDVWELIRTGWEKTFRARELRASGCRPNAEDFAIDFLYDEKAAALLLHKGSEPGEVIGVVCFHVRERPGVVGRELYVDLASGLQGDDIRGRVAAVDETLDEIAERLECERIMYEGRRGWKAYAKYNEVSKTYARVPRWITSKTKSTS